MKQPKQLFNESENLGLDADRSSDNKIRYDQDSDRISHNPDGEDDDSDGEALIGNSPLEDK